jgi:hypothetical protein
LSFIVGGDLLGDSSKNLERPDRRRDLLRKTRSTPLLRKER